MVEVGSLLGIMTGPALGSWLESLGIRRGVT